MAASTNPEKRLASRAPVYALALIATYMFTIGIRVNYPYSDEICFVDPVINYIQGHGFKTATWNVSDISAPHVSTAPAYCALLYLWLKAVGVSMYRERALSILLALASVFVIWRASLRLGIIRSGAAGVILVCVMIFDYGYAFSYGCGREDGLTALLTATMIYLTTLKNKWVGLPLMAMIGAVMPFVQWSAIVFLLFLSFALFLITGFKYWKPIGAVCIAMGLGLVIQKSIYIHLGLWDTWVATVNSEGSQNIIERIKYRLSMEGVRHHSNVLPKDFSAASIVLGMAAVYIWGAINNDKTAKYFARITWMVIFVLVIGVYCIAKFPTYYGWMLSLPLGMILSALYDKMSVSGRSGARITAAIAMISCCVGEPLQAGVALYDWKERQGAGIASWLGPKITKNDVVYCDYPFYFIAKPRAKEVFVGSYGKIMTPEEFKQVTLAIIGTNGARWGGKFPADENIGVWKWSPARRSLPGNNSEFGILSAPNYACIVYRLKATAN